MQRRVRGRALVAGCPVLAAALLLFARGAAGIDLDRKVLSDLAIREPEAFAAIVASAQTALDQAQPAAA
jgi:hypothetical protein